jgi:hypothetical protein
VLVLAAIDQHFVFYASEARPYALVQLLGVVQVMIYLRLVGQTTATRWPNFDRQLVGWCVLSALLFALQYTTALLLAAELLWGLGLAIVSRRHRVQVTMLVFGLAGPLAVVWFRRRPRISECTPIQRLGVRPSCRTRWTCLGDSSSAGRKAACETRGK